MFTKTTIWDRFKYFTPLNIKFK